MSEGPSMALHQTESGYYLHADNSASASSEPSKASVRATMENGHYANTTMSSYPGMMVNCGGQPDTHCDSAPQPANTMAQAGCSFAPYMGQHQQYQFEWQGNNTFAGNYWGGADPAYQMGYAGMAGMGGMGGMSGSNQIAGYSMYGDMGSMSNNPYNNEALMMGFVQQASRPVVWGAHQQSAAVQQMAHPIPVVQQASFKPVTSGQQSEVESKLDKRRRQNRESQQRFRDKRRREKTGGKDSKATKDKSAKTTTVTSPSFSKAITSAGRNSSSMSSRASPGQIS